jgi:hypothetical protein
MKQFEFLKNTNLYEHITKLETHALSEPIYAGVLMRIILEKSVLEAFNRSYDLIYPKYNNSLNDLINNSELTDVLYEFELINAANQIRKVGNKASHDPSRLKESDILLAIENLHKYLLWFADYTLELDVEEEQTFKASWLKNSLTNDIDFKKKISDVEQELEQTKKQLIKLQAEKIQKVEQEQKEEQKEDIVWQNVGLTEQYGLIWGKVFINFIFQNEPFYAIKHFVNEGGAKEKCDIHKGRFEDNRLFKQFPKGISNLNRENVLKGASDSYNLVTSFSKEKFGTASVLLQRLCAEVVHKMKDRKRKMEAFINNNILAQRFDFEGAYYTREDQKYRSQLVINRKQNSSNTFNALVIMLNPGGSYPLNDQFQNITDSTQLHSLTLTPCRPDDTQYQICRIMEIHQWNKVLVLNLFDICNVYSSDVVERYTKRENLIESIFHEDRREELSLLANNLEEEAPLILAWGTNQHLTGIKKAVYNGPIIKLNKIVIGLKKTDFQFYHPWPRGEESEMRYEWPSKMSNIIKNKNILALEWPKNID